MKNDPQNFGRSDGSSLPSVPLCQADPSESSDRPFHLGGRDHVSAAGEPAARPLARWHREYVNRLHHLFVRAETRIGAGEKVTRVFRHQAWWLKRTPRFYRCDRSKPFRLSYNSLLRLFYKWRKGGKNPECLILKYRSGRPRIKATEVEKFALACVEAGVTSLRKAHARMTNPVASPDGFRHALLGRRLKAITELLRARRTAIRLEDRTKKILSLSR